MLARRNGGGSIRADPAQDVFLSHLGIIHQNYVMVGGRIVDLIPWKQLEAEAECRRWWERRNGEMLPQKKFILVHYI